MATLSPTFLNIMTKGLSMHDILLKQYNEFRGKKFFGTYWPIGAQPILILRDLDLVQDMFSEQ